MHFYQRHLGDYARDAGYLTLAQHGAYTLLLDWYYANERGIPKDLVYGICRASTQAEKQAVLRVLNEFFRWDGKLWKHKRVEQEIAKMREKSAKAADAAKRRWDADAMRTHSERNAIQEPILPITNTPQRVSGLQRVKVRLVNGGGTDERTR
jgi:uncharacterized protein YdaU (DUF1376 family)